MNHQRIKYLKLLQQKVAQSSADENSLLVNSNQSNGSNGFTELGESRTQSLLTEHHMEIDKPPETLDLTVKALELSDSSSASNGGQIISPNEDAIQPVMDTSLENNIGIVEETNEENLVVVSDYDSDDSEWEEKMASAQRRKEAVVMPADSKNEPTPNSIINTASENRNFSKNIEADSTNAIPENKNENQSTNFRPKESVSAASSNSRIKIVREGSRNSTKLNDVKPSMSITQSSLAGTSNPPQTITKEKNIPEISSQNEGYGQIKIKDETKQHGVMSGINDPSVNTSIQTKKKISFGKSANLIATARSNLYKRNYFSLDLASSIPFSLPTPIPLDTVSMDDIDIVTIDDVEVENSAVQEKSLMVETISTNRSGSLPIPTTIDLLTERLPSSNEQKPDQSTHSTKTTQSLANTSSTSLTENKSISHSDKRDHSNSNNRVSETRDNRNLQERYNKSQPLTSSRDHSSRGSGDRYRDLPNYPPREDFHSYDSRNPRDNHSRDRFDENRHRERSRDRSSERHHRERSRERNPSGGRRETADYYSPNAISRDSSSFRRSSSHDRPDHHPAPDLDYFHQFSGENNPRSSKSTYQNSKSVHSEKVKVQERPTGPSLLQDREMAEKYHKEKKEQAINDLLGTPDEDEDEEMDVVELALSKNESSAVGTEIIHSPKKSSLPPSIPPKSTLVTSSSEPSRQLPTGNGPVVSSTSLSTRNQNSATITAFTLPNSELAVRYPIHGNGFSFSSSDHTVHSASTLRELQLLHSEMEKLVKLPHSFFQRYGKGLLIMLKKKEGDMMRQIFLLEEIIPRVETDIITRRPRETVKIVLRPLKKSPTDQRTIFEVSLNDIDEQYLNAYEHIHFTQHLTDESKALLNETYIINHLHYAKVLRNIFQNRS